MRTWVLAILGLFYLTFWLFFNVTSDCRSWVVGWLIYSLWTLEKKTFLGWRELEGWRHPGRHSPAPLPLEINSLPCCLAWFGIFPCLGPFPWGRITNKSLKDCVRTRDSLCRTAASCTAAKLERVPLDWIGSCVMDLTRFSTTVILVCKKAKSSMPLCSLRQQTWGGWVG